MDFDFTDVDLNTLITRALQVLLIVIVVLVVIAISKRVVKRMLSRRIYRIREETPEELESRQNTIASVINQVIAFAAWLIAIVMILSVFGLNTGPLIAAVGVAGLAVGFAAQSIIRDYINGMFIVMEDWYRIDEVATISGTTGVVVDMNLRRTTLRDINGTMHIIPNSKADMASNWAREWARINLNVGVAYKEDINRVWKLLDEICQELSEDSDWGPNMITVPSVIRVDTLGDSAVELKVLGDTKPGKQWALTGELRKRIKNRFDQEGIEIPWPHTKVYFGDAQPGEKAGEPAIT
ncbi:MAG: mechanosensitive ion channel family protein [Dehalococcoidia bacterium]